MKIDEVIQKEILDEGVKDTLKKLGLGALLAVSVATGSVQAKDFSASELTGMGFTSTQAEFISKLPEKQQALLVAKKQKAGDNTADKEIERTKEIFSKLKTFDKRIRSYEYNSKTRTLVLYGAWPKGPGYDGDNVAEGWTIEFDPRIVRFVQLWSLDGKTKFGSSINKSKNRW
jgi:hypothetical protein